MFLPTFREDIHFSVNPLHKYSWRHAPKVSPLITELLLNQIKLIVQANSSLELCWLKKMLLLRLGQEVLLGMGRQGTGKMDVNYGTPWEREVWRSGQHVVVTPRFCDAAWETITHVQMEKPCLTCKRELIRLHKMAGKNASSNGRISTDSFGIDLFMGFQPMEIQDNLSICPSYQERGERVVSMASFYVLQCPGLSVFCSPSISLWPWHAAKQLLSNFSSKTASWHKLLLCTREISLFPLSCILSEETS